MRLVFAIVGLTTVFASPVADAETPALQFVSTYVSQLGTIENIRASSDKSLKAGDDAWSNCIAAMTGLGLELSADSRMMQSYELSSDFSFLPKGISDIYERKISLYSSMKEICVAFKTAEISGPKSGVDYGAMTAAMPELRAKAEFADKSLFDVTPAVFATLIDKKPDAQNQLGRLVISKAERQQLIEKIDLEFGAKLNQPDQNAIVSIATVLKFYLQKDFKAADE